VNLTLRTLPGVVEARIAGAHDLFAGSVTLRLPAGCAFSKLAPGDLLEHSGEPLALAGPRADGSILAASSLRGGMKPVAGDGTLLRLQVTGECADIRVLEASAYDERGAALQVSFAPELPGSGPSVLPALLAALVLAHRFGRTGRIGT
jgi:hypothetical protein